MTADDAGTVPEPGSGPTLAVPAPNQGPSRRRRFRGWRHSRPFSGGLLLILSGLELLFIPLSGVLFHGAVKLVIYIGIGGVFGVVIGALLIAAGLATWFTPAYRTFYGIAGIMLGLASFPATNLGGFLLGMLLALLGGSLVFAWTPLEQAPSAADGAREGVAPPDDASVQVVPIDGLLTADDEALPDAEEEAPDAEEEEEEAPLDGDHEGQAEEAEDEVQADDAGSQQITSLAKESEAALS